MSHAITIPEACEFPQLHAMIDPGRLAAVLDEHLGAGKTCGGVRLQQCRIERLHYKPGKCHLQMEATLSDAAGREIGKQKYFGKVFRPAQSRAAFEKALGAELITPAYGQAVGLIPEWDMVVWAYPNDPSLTGIALLMNPEKLQRTIAAQPESFGLTAGTRPAGVTTQLIKYVAGHRCMYLLTIALAGSEDGSPPARAFAKAYTGGEGAGCFNVMMRLWQSAARQRGEFHVPQPYSYDREHDIVWQQALRGHALTDLPNWDHLPALASLVGRELAGFHNSDLKFPKQMTFAFQMQELHGVHREVNSRFSQYAAPFNAAYDRLLTAAAHLPEAALTPVHGSFKSSHVFFDGEGIAFIDFDGVNQGDPGYDLGRFIAYLGRIQLLGRISATIARDTIASFCDAYQQAVAHPVPHERIVWFARCQLLSSQVHKAMKSFDTTLVRQYLELLTKNWPMA